jgi:hypothetical protein
MVGRETLRRANRSLNAKNIQAEWRQKKGVVSWRLGKSLLSLPCVPVLCFFPRALGRFLPCPEGGPYPKDPQCVGQA